MYDQQAASPVAVAGLKLSTLRQPQGGSFDPLERLRLHVVEVIAEVVSLHEGLRTP
jgi:hypothetical protein